MFRTKQQENKSSGVSHVLNIATIISSTVICLKLILWGVLPLDTAGLLMIGVVVCVAVGKSYMKLAIAGVSVYLFVKSLSGNDEAAFQEGLTAVLTLLIMLFGLYIIIRGLFHSK